MSSDWKQRKGKIKRETEIMNRVPKKIDITYKVVDQNPPFEKKRGKIHPITWL